MTDEQKVEALTELLGDVMHTLEMKQYDILSHYGQRGSTNESH